MATVRYLLPVHYTGAVYTNRGLSAVRGLSALTTMSWLVNAIGDGGDMSAISYVARGSDGRAPGSILETGISGPIPLSTGIYGPVSTGV